MEMGTDRKWRYNAVRKCVNLSILTIPAICGQKGSVTPANQLYPLSRPADASPRRSATCPPGIGHIWPTTRGDRKGSTQWGGGGGRRDGGTAA